MNTPDPFTAYYAPLLDNTYDVVDRIVINAFFSLGGSPGGFRTFWREWQGGDANLDDTHLMRVAGRFARRVRGWAKKHNIPVIYCKVGDRKHQIAEQHRPTDPDFTGIFAVMVNRVPTPVWQVLRFPNGGLHLKRKQPMPFVYHYSFHVIDAEWGHVTIKMSGHAPFSAQVMLNGHEFTACQARKKGIAFAKEGNCFTEVADAEALARVADALRSPAAVGRLEQVCERWIYRCVCFGLPFEDQKRTGFRYRYSVFQVEYSRNLLFHNGHHMEQVFNGVIDRTRSLLDIRRVMTIFGVKHRRRARPNGEPPREETVLEMPVYDLTIFKVHFGRLTLKIYTKGECVLRTEAIAHNVADLKCGRLLEKFPEVVGKLSELLGRFFEALRCVDVAWISDKSIEELPTPGVVGKTRVGGIDLNKARVRAVIAGVVSLALMPRGFTASDLAAKLRETWKGAGDYAPRHASYDLKKLRAKGLVRKAGDRSHRYEVTPDGLRLMAGYTVLREKVLKPLLTYKGRCKSGPKVGATAEIDMQYQAVQRQMQHLFKLLRLAA